MKDTTKAGVLAVVRRMIARNLENKFIGWKVEQDVAHNSPIGAADCEPVVGAITPIDSATGNTSQQRMGDRIKPKSLTVKGVITFNNDQPLNTTQNFLVRVLILAQKNIKNGSTVLGGGVDTNRLLRPGFATGVGSDQVPFGGTPMDVMSPINTDLFRVYYDRVFKLSGQLVTGGAREQQNCTIRWKYNFKDLPSTLTFDEGSGDWANNFAPFVAIGYAYADGSVPDTLASRLLTNTVSFLSFEDA